MSPEIGLTLRAGGRATNYHDVGEGPPLLMIHGSGPGVSSWANWRLNIPELAKRFRVLAPDMAGFGYTERRTSDRYDKALWLEHLLDFMDALGLERADILGNSFGGGLAIALAADHPMRVRKLVLMGSVGVDFSLTAGLDKVWGYEPSAAAMRELLDLFAYEKRFATDELAELRYRASVQPGFQEAFRSMFPAPRQRWIRALATPEAQIATLPHPTLILHGREDEIIPPENARRLFELIPDAELHMFGACGHWTQIEHTARFNQLVAGFLLD